MNPESHVSAVPFDRNALPPSVTDESIVDQLMRRIQTLEVEKRRWKSIGLVSLALLLLVFVSGTGVVGVAAFSSLGVKRVRMDQLRALEEAELQLRMAEERREQAEQERQEAERLRDKLKDQ